MAAEEKDVIQYELAPNGICRIWLNRPHKRNCVSPQLLRDLEVAVDRAAADKNALCVVFRGRGNTFCSGADLDQLVSPVLGESTDSLQLAVDAGVDFPRLLLELMAGGTPAPVTGYRAGVRSRWWWGDVDHLLARLTRSDARLALPPGSPSRIAALFHFLRLWWPGDQNEVFRWQDPWPAVRETVAWFRR